MSPVTYLASSSSGGREKGSLHLKLNPYIHHFHTLRFIQVELTVSLTNLLHMIPLIFVNSWQASKGYPCFMASYVNFSSYGLDNEIVLYRSPVPIIFYNL